MQKKINLNAKRVEYKYNLNHYESLQRLMFERISVSGYQDDFILKGRLLLMAMFSVENKTIKDMDATLPE